MRDLKNYLMFEFFVSSLTPMSSTLEQANIYTDAEVSGAVAECKQYTDEAASVLDTKIDETTADILQDAKDYTDTEIADILATMDNVIKIDSTITSSELNLLLADTNKKVKNIYFTAGTYTLGDIRLKANTHILLDKNAVINVIDKHLFFNFETTDTEVLGYNGQGNITVEGGTLNGHACSFIHADNVVFKGIKFNNTANDHYFEIAACRNFKIENCHFRGMITQIESRDYVEYVQLDQPTFVGFPHLGDENSLTFDGTANTNIYIIGCTFDKGSTTGYDNIYAAIGSHGSGANYQTQIYILNNKFLNCTHAAIAARGWKYVIVDNNTFDYCSASLQVKYGNSDISFKNNFVDHADNGIYCLNDNNSTFYFLKIDGNKFDNCLHRLNVNIIEQEGVTPSITGGQIYDTNNRIEDSGTDIIRCKGFYYACGNVYVRINEGAGYVILLDKTTDCTITNCRFSKIALKSGETTFNIARVATSYAALMINNNRCDSTLLYNAAWGNGDYVNTDGNTQLITAKDLNACFDTGNYYGYSCTNTPSEVENGRFTLQVYNRNGYLSQVLISTYSNEMFTRTYYNAWGTWAKIAKSVDVENQFSLVKTMANVDLNTMTESGRYYCSNCTNTPLQVGSGRFVLNVIGNGEYLSQTLDFLYENRKFMRAWHTVWKEWVECTNKVTDIDGIDLDTMKNDGVYYGVNCTNTPSEVGTAKFTLTVLGNGEYVSQTLEYLYSNKKYMRTWHDSWKTWVETTNTSSYNLATINKYDFLNTEMNLNSVDIDIDNKITTGAYNAIIIRCKSENAYTICRTKCAETLMICESEDYPVAGTQLTVLFGDLENANYDSTKTVTTTANGRYLIIFYYSADKSNGYRQIQVQKGIAIRNSIYGTAWLPYALNQKDILYGKVISAIGDSYTKGNILADHQTWLAKLAKRNGMAYYNRGKNGDLIAWDGINNLDNTSVVRRFDDEMPANSDIVVVFGGHNDATKNIPIGTNTDNVDTTFKGALNILVGKAITKYPRALIIFVTPSWRYNVEEPYSDAMQEICELNNIICINSFTDFNFSLKNAAQNARYNERWVGLYDKYGSNRSHFNEEGHERVSYIIEGKIRQNIFE